MTTSKSTPASLAAAYRASRIPTGLSGMSMVPAYLFSALYCVWACLIVLIVVWAGMMFYSVSRMIAFRRKTDE